MNSWFFRAPQYIGLLLVYWGTFNNPIGEAYKLNQPVNVMFMGFIWDQ